MACSEGPDGILREDSATKWGEWGLTPVVKKSASGVRPH